MFEYYQKSMQKKYFYFIYLLASVLGVTLFSCKDQFHQEDYTAYFGGEIENPKNNYLIFMKGDQVIDTFYLDKNNRFFHKFDSLTPGLYSFKNEPEYQYVYFEKNDSLLIQLNANDFDNSLVFCGRGDEKNNFLMELYLQNEADRNTIFEAYEKDVTYFEKSCKKNYDKAKALYLKRKTFIKWSNEFDKLALASVELNNAYKKEVYPIAHEFRTGNSIKNNLSSTYYNHRKVINLNDATLANYSPFVNYVTVLLNNMVVTQSKKMHEEMSLESNIIKLEIADKLIKNKHVKNLVVNNIANMYLLSDQCTENNAKFFDLYAKIATDEKLKKQIMATSKRIHDLHKNAKLPKIRLTDINGSNVILPSAIRKKSVLFFWTKDSESHAIFAHKKITELKSKYPNYQFIAINVDENSNDWKTELKKHTFEPALELHASNFEELKEKWIINKIHRTMIINANGTIKNAFVSLFDVNFEEHLKE